MKNQNLSRLEGKKEFVHKCHPELRSFPFERVPEGCYPRAVDRLLGFSIPAVLQCSQQWPQHALKMLKRVQHDFMGKCAFTLIELLVVVLIIGILTSVAVPQYQKAVWKSQLAQWNVIFNAAQRATSMFKLEEGGFPATLVRFTGKYREKDLPLSGNCNSDSYYCDINGNNVRVYCDEQECWMQISSSKLGMVTMHDKGKGYVVFDVHVRNNGSASTLCQWLRDNNGTVYSVQNYPKAVCEAYIRW